MHEHAPGRRPVAWAWIRPHARGITAKSRFDDKRYGSCVCVPYHLAREARIPMAGKVMQDMNGCTVYQLQV